MVRSRSIRSTAVIKWNARIHHH